ncbi:MAG: type II secretion system F family protein [Acidimicrobiales bacterium]|nr:type II secretion system F family protein [Acidimicrobiales bacterium]
MRARLRPPAPAPPWITALARELPGAVEERTLWRGACAAAVAAPLAGGIVAGSPIGIFLIVVVLTAPRVAAPLLLRRRVAQRDALLPDALDRLASAIRSGTAVRPALVAVARRSPSPLAEELAPLADALDHGAPLRPTLDGWSHRAMSRDVALAAAAIGLGAAAGGQVARALDGVAATLRERRELQAEVRALATQARASAGVLVLAPLGFTALVSTIEPGAVRFLVATPTGLACLVMGLALDGVGAWWMRRIVEQAT